MRLLSGLVAALSRLNGALLAAGRVAAWICVAFMVAAILAQVFFRYVLNDALPWPEEFARVMMIWMTAFAAPTAYRYGGFVSIDMIRDALPGALRRAVSLALLLLAAAVLVQLFLLALDFAERGLRPKMASLWAPSFGFGEDGGFGYLGWTKLSRIWAYAAMPVGFGAMLLVNLELILRQVGRAAAGEEAFPDPPPHAAYRSAE